MTLATAIATAKAAATSVETENGCIGGGQNS